METYMGYEENGLEQGKGMNLLYIKCLYKVTTNQERHYSVEKRL